MFPRATLSAAFAHAFSDTNVHTECYSNALVCTNFYTISFAYWDSFSGAYIDAHCYSNYRPLGYAYSQPALPLLRDPPSRF